MVMFVFWAEIGLKSDECYNVCQIFEIPQIVRLKIK